MVLLDALESHSQSKSHSLFEVDSSHDGGVTISRFDKVRMYGTGGHESTELLQQPLEILHFTFMAQIHTTARDTHVVFVI